MPSGIILQSGSVGATQEAIEKVLTDNGYEAEKPVVEAVELVEPKRDDFPSDEEFEKAQEAYDTTVEEQERADEEKEEEAERKRLAALPKKSRKQRAIEKATADVKRQLDDANARIAALEGKKPGTAAAAAVEAPIAPKREDFDSDEKFEDALFDYRYQMRRAKEAAEEAQKNLKSRLEANFTDYKDAVAAFKEEHDDWEKVVNQSIALPEAVYYAIVDLGKEGPPVTYYLGQHPEFLAEMAQLTPYRAAVEIGRLAAKLTPAAERQQPKPRLRTSIPEPVRPVSTSATSSSLTSREAAQKRDYKSFKKAQRRGA